MSEVADVANRHRGEVDLGHPVRSFATVMIGLALLLLAVQWTGVVQPRVQVAEGGQSQSEAGHRVSVVVHNDGGLRVRVTGIRFPGTEATDALVLVAERGEAGVPGRATQPFAPFDLDPDESRVVSLFVPGGCAGEVDQVDVQVRSPIGLTRTIGLAPNGTAGDPIC